MELCVSSLTGTLSSDAFLPNLHRIAGDAPQEWSGFLEDLRAVISKISSSAAAGVPGREGGVSEEGTMRLKLGKMVEELRLLSSPLHMCIASEPQVLYICICMCIYVCCLCVCFCFAYEHRV